MPSSVPVGLVDGDRQLGLAGPVGGGPQVLGVAVLGAAQVAVGRVGGRRSAPRPRPARRGRPGRRGEGSRPQTRRPDPSAGQPASRQWRSAYGPDGSAPSAQSGWLGGGCDRAVVPEDLDARDQLGEDQDGEEDQEGCHGSNSPLGHIPPPVAGLTTSRDFLPYCRRVIRNVAVPVLDEVFAFELGVLCEVFGVDRPDDPTAAVLRLRAVHPDARPGAHRVRASTWWSSTASTGSPTADLVAVPAIQPRRRGARRSWSRPCGPRRPAAPG